MGYLTGMVAALLATVVVGARPAAALAQVDPNSPDYHITYTGAAFFTAGPGNTDEVTWAAAGDVWVFPNPTGTAPMPPAALKLATLEGKHSVTFPGYPTCTAGLRPNAATQGAKYTRGLTFRYFATGFINPDGDGPYMEFSFPYVPVYMDVTEPKSADPNCANTSSIYDIFNPNTGANGLANVVPDDTRETWLANYVARTDLLPSVDEIQASEFVRSFDFDYAQAPREIHIHSTVDVQLLEAHSRS